MRVFGRKKRYCEQTEGSKHQQGGYCEEVNVEDGMEGSVDVQDAGLQGSNDTGVNNRRCAIRVQVDKERICSEADGVGDDGAQRRGR